MNLENLKALYQAVDFVKATAEYGLLLPGVALNAATTLVSYADASWANAEKLKSQFGVLVFATWPQVTQTSSLGFLLDWRSGKSSRVCRSTLAAEAMAADEAVDRTMYMNLFLTEIHPGEPAHRARALFRHLHVTDAKSLYHVICSENPTLAQTLLGQRSSSARVHFTLRDALGAGRPHASRWSHKALRVSTGRTAVLVATPCLGAAA